MKKHKRERVPAVRERAAIDRVTAATSEPARHGATLALSANRSAGLSMEMKLSATGLIAVGGMVSAILLATSVLVGVAIRESRRPRPW